ncbi:Thiolase [Moelleriella libera RCEF 2490]|uniref:acetyl-CoA C-acyltransferase n=1 Tax=Moelleriella libera RCEF 2490 TaxID=1081109 RepID=A0A168F4F4_9HYPO|nr:Thiolase [Moelleriella libera RCEF 2490]
MATHARGLANILAKLPADAVILSSVRTPVCRAHKGKFKDAYPEELLAAVLAHIRSSAEAADVQDVGVGVVLSELGGSKAARMAMNHVGYANETSLFTINRACASSLHAIATVAAHIRTGMISAGIGAGMESMTRNYATRAVPVDLWPALRDSPNRHARDCVMSMGLTSENVASRYGVSRADQDAFAQTSHLRAAKARGEHCFREEIVPVTTSFFAEGGEGGGGGGGGDGEEESSGQERRQQQVRVTCDDGIRPGISLEALARLKPAFKPDGTSTAGNSSQVSDGAAATLLMRRSVAVELGLGALIMGNTLLHGLRRDGVQLGVVSMCVGTGMGMAALFARE